MSHRSKTLKANPPKYLSPESRRLWRAITGEWMLDPHHLHLLRCCCEALDTAERARIELAKSGDFFINRHNEIKPHPAINVQRDAIGLFNRTLKALGLDIEEVKPATPEWARREEAQ